jgi:hypothetical protein
MEYLVSIGLGIIVGVLYHFHYYATDIGFMFSLLLCFLYGLMIWAQNIYNTLINGFRSLNIKR